MPLDLATVPVVPFLLVAARVVPAIVAIPALGGTVLPAPARVVLGLAVAALVWPHVAPPGDGSSFALLLLREAALGTLVGWLGALPFRAVEAAGRLVDALRGANLAELVSPELGARTSPTAELYLRLSTLAFLVGGGHRLLLFGLADSYRLLPLSGANAASAAGLLEVTMATTGAVLAAALAIALPALLALLVADLAMGVVGRAAPQLGLQAVLMPARAMLGTLLTLLTLGVTLAVLTGELEGFGRRVALLVGG